MFNPDDFRLISGFGVSILSSAEGIASLMKYILANSPNPFLDQPFLRAPVLKLNRNSQTIQQTDYNLDNDSEHLTNLFDILSLSKNFNKLFTPLFVLRIPVPVKIKFKKEITNPNVAIITNYIIPLIKSALAEKPEKMSRIFEILIDFVNSNTTISNDTDIAYTSGMSEIIYQGLTENTYEFETLEVILNAWVKLIAQFGSSIDCYLLAKIWLNSSRRPLLDLSELAKSIDYANPPQISTQPRPRCKRKPLIHFLIDLSSFKFTLSEGYIYAVSEDNGLIKIGTGYMGTVSASIVNQNTSLIPNTPHFICVCDNTIIIQISDIEHKFYLVYLDAITLKILKKEETFDVEPIYSYLCCSKSYLYKLDSNGLLRKYELDTKSYELKEISTKQTKFDSNELLEMNAFVFTNGFNFYIHSSDQIFEISIQSGEMRQFTIPDYSIFQYKYVFDSYTGQYFIIDDRRLSINSDENTFYFLDLPQKKFETPFDILHFLIYSHETISKGYSISPSFDIFIDMIESLIPIQSSDLCELAPVFLECSIQSIKAGNLIPLNKIDIYMKRADYFLKFYKTVFLRFICKFIQCGDSNYQSEFLNNHIKTNDNDDKLDLEIIFEASSSLQCFQSVYIFHFLSDEYCIKKIWQLFDQIDHKSVAFLNVLSESISCHMSKTPLSIVKLIQRFMNIVHYSNSPLFLTFLQSFFDIFRNSLEYMNDSSSMLIRILPQISISRKLSELNWYNFRLFSHFPLFVKEKSSVSVSSHLFELELPVQGEFELIIDFDNPITNKMLNVVIYTTKSQREHVYYLPSSNEPVKNLKKKFICSYIAVDLNLNDKNSKINFYYSLNLTLPIVGATETLMNLNIIQLYWSQGLFKCEQLYHSNQKELGSQLFNCIFEYIPVDLFHKVYKKFNSIDSQLFKSSEAVQIIQNKMKSKNFNESLFYLSIASRLSNEFFDSKTILNNFKEKFEQFSFFVYKRFRILYDLRKINAFYESIQKGTEIREEKKDFLKLLKSFADLNLNCYINFNDFVSYVQNQLLFIIQNCSQNQDFYSLFIQYLNDFCSQKFPMVNLNLIVYLKCLLQFSNNFFTENDLMLVKKFVLIELPLIPDLQVLFFYEKIFQKLNLRVCEIDDNVKAALNSVIIRHSSFEDKFCIQMCRFFRKFMTVDAFNGLSEILSNTNEEFVNENGDFHGQIVGALMILATRHSPVFINDKYIMTSNRMKSLYSNLNQLSLDQSNSAQIHGTSNESTPIISNSNNKLNDSPELDLKSNQIGQNGSKQINSNEVNTNLNEIKSTENQLELSKNNSELKLSELKANDISFDLESKDYFYNSEFNSNIYELHNFNKMKINFNSHNEIYQEKYGYNYKDCDSIELNLIEYSPLLFTFETDDKYIISHPPFDFHSILPQIDNSYYKRILIDPLPKLNKSLINSVINLLKSDLKPIALDALTDLTINSPLTVKDILKKFKKIGFYEKRPLFENDYPSIYENSLYYIQFEKQPTVNFVIDTNFTATTIAEMQNDFKTIENKRKKFKVAREFSVFLRNFFSSKHKAVNVYSYDQPSFNFSLMLSRYEKYKLLLNDDHNREICIWSITDNFISTVLPGNSQPIIECLFGISIEFQVVYLKMQSHFWVNPIQYFTPNKIVRLGIVGTEMSFDAFVEDEPPEFLTAANRPYLLLIDHSLKSLEFSNQFNLNSDVTFLPFIKNEKQVFFMEIAHNSKSLKICLSPSFLSSLTFYEFDISVDSNDMQIFLLLIDFKQRKIMIKNKNKTLRDSAQSFEYIPFVCISLKITQMAKFEFNFGRKNFLNPKKNDNVLGCKTQTQKVKLNNDKRVLSSYKFNPSIHTPFQPTGLVFPKEIGRPSFLNYNSIQICGSITKMDYISMNLKIPFEKFMVNEDEGKINSELFERKSIMKGNYSFFSSQPLKFPRYHSNVNKDYKIRLDSKKLNQDSCFYNDDKYNNIFHDMFLVSSPFDSIDNVEIATVHSLFFLRDKINQTFNIDFSRLSKPSLFEYDGSFCNPHNMTLKNLELNVQRKSEIIINIFSQIPDDQFQNFFSSCDSFYSQLFIQAVSCLSEIELRTDYYFSNLLFKIIHFNPNRNSKSQSKKSELNQQSDTNNNDSLNENNQSNDKNQFDKMNQNNSDKSNQFDKLELNKNDQIQLNEMEANCGNIQLVKEYLLEISMLFTNLNKLMKDNCQYQIIHANSVGNFERISDLDCDLIFIKQTKIGNSKNKIKLIQQNKSKLILKTYSKHSNPIDQKVNYNCIQTYLRSELIFDRIGFMDAILCTFIPINFKQPELIQLNKDDEHYQKSVGYGFSIHFVNHLYEYIKKSNDRIMANVFHKYFLLPVYNELVYRCSAVFDTYLAKWFSILITHRHLFTEKALFQYRNQIKVNQFDQCPYNELTLIARMINLQSEVMCSANSNRIELEGFMEFTDDFSYNDTMQAMNNQQEISDVYLEEQLEIQHNSSLNSPANDQSDSNLKQNKPDSQQNQSNSNSPHKELLADSDTPQKDQSNSKANADNSNLNENDQQAEIQSPNSKENSNQNVIDLRNNLYDDPNLKQKLIKSIQSHFLIDHSFPHRQISIYQMIAADFLNPLGSHFPFFNSITKSQIVITHPIIQELFKWRPDYRPNSYSIHLLSPQFPIQHKIPKDSIPIVYGITPKSFRIDLYNDDQTDETYSIISNNSNALLPKNLKIFYLQKFNSLPNFTLMNRFHYHLAILREKWSIRDESISFFINNLLASFKIEIMNFIPFSDILEKLFPKIKPETASIQLMLSSYRYRNRFKFHSPYEQVDFLNEIAVDYLKFNKKSYARPIIKQKVQLTKQISQNISMLPSVITSTIQKFENQKIENQIHTFSEVYLKLGNYFDFIFPSNYNEIESLNNFFNDEMTENDLFVRNPITKIYSPSPDALSKRQLDAFVAFGSHLVIAFESQIQLPIVVSRVVIRFAFDNELILDDFLDFDPDFALNGSVSEIPMKIRPIKKQLEAIRLGILKLRPIKYHSYFAYSWFPRVVQMMPLTDVLKMLNENQTNRHFIVMKSVELIIKNLEENGQRELLDFNCLI